MPETNTKRTQYGVLVFRKTGLDDARHVAFARLFGELDDVRPYLTLGRKNRFPFDELFDVSNLEDDGSLVKLGSKRHHMGMVSSRPHAHIFSPNTATANEVADIIDSGKLDLPRRLIIQSQKSRLLVAPST